mgnify:FL=1
MNTRVPGVGIHHIALRTNDYERTVEFYQEILGCTLKLAWEAADGRKLCLLDLGAGGPCIEVIGHGPDEPAATPGQFHPWMHLTLTTDDPDRVWRAAVEAGYPSVMEPKDVMLGDQPARIAFFSGPSGEVLEVFREG